jgi:hypothetical protein
MEFFNDLYHFIHFSETFIVTFDFFSEKRTKNQALLLSLQ